MSSSIPASSSTTPASSSTIPTSSSTIPTSSRTISTSSKPDARMIGISKLIEEINSTAIASFGESHPFCLRITKIISSDLNPEEQTAAIKKARIDIFGAPHPIFSRKEIRDGARFADPS